MDIYSIFQQFVETNGGAVEYNQIGITKGSKSIPIKMSWDKGREKSAYAYLNENDDGSFYGMMHLWSGDKYKFYYKANESGPKITKPKIDPLDIQKREQEEIRKAKEHLERIRQEWKGYKSLVSHPYLDYKCLTLIDGLRSDNSDNLITPVYNSSMKIMGYHSISSTEFSLKKYAYGTQKTGNFFPIGLKKRTDTHPEIRISDCDFLLLGEGLATVASAYQALNEHIENKLFVGFVAFDALNMINVTDMMIRLFANKEIILIVDNDCESERNTGYNVAHEIIARYNKHTIIPLFIPSEDGKKIDANDFIIKYGPLKFTELVNTTLKEFHKC